MIKRIFILFIAAFVLSMPVLAQKGISGSWEWTSRPNKNKEQVYFSVDVKQKNGSVSGRYWFNQLIDGEGSDASFVLFVGTIKGDTAVIEFNPEDIHGIDEENVRYKKPKTPATATLKLAGGKLEWTLGKGKIDAGDLIIPKQMTLKRAK